MLTSARKRLVWLVFRLLRIRWANKLLTRLFKLSGRRLPIIIMARFPVTSDVKVTLPNSHTIVLRTDGRDTIASRMYWQGIQAHEPETIAIYLELIPKVNIVFDVGASSGLFSLIAGVVNPKLTIHAFEPVPETFEFLANNIAVNNLQNIVPVLACATDYDGSITVYPNLSPALPFQASTTPGYQGHSTPREITARSLTLDSYASSNKLDKIDLMKIDAEASDHTVLEGSKGIVARYRPLIICEVLFEDTDHRLEAFFHGTGYKYFSIEESGLVPRTEVLGDSNYIYRNFLFVHESKVNMLGRLIRNH